MKKRPLLRLLLGAVLGNHGSSLFTVYSNSGEVHHFPSAEFIYFGPQGATVANASTVFLNGPATCAPRKDFVQGKIVVTDFIGVDCQVFSNADHRP